jgi:hypothetical protein
MGIEYGERTAVFVGFIGVDEAEGLLGWLQEHPVARVDLAPCLHVHAADLQVLIAARAPVVRWPVDEDFRSWLQSVLKEER